MFQVFVKDEPADCCNRSKFNTYEEALDYAKNYLGWYSAQIEQMSDTLPVGVAYDYSGYGNLIEIREVE